MITSDSLPETDSIPGRDTLEEVDGSSGTSFSHPNQLSMYEKDAVFSHEAMVTQEDIDMEFTFDLSTPNDGVSYHSDYAELDQVDLQSPLSNSALPFFQYQAQGSAIVPISKTPSGPQTLSVQEKYLMRHYMDRVVHLFTVIRNQKSPWKTQHLPRALQAAGELDIAGSTSKIRVALLRTLLSISAFVLSNDHKVHGRNEKAESWREVASTLRSQAIRLLKLAIETDLHSPTAWRYKEFLATMLSMVTIDVSSSHYVHGHY
jgi:arginine metabolism regulation protein II